MATLAQIRTQVDTALASLWSQIVTKQAAYFAANGRYFQGIRTHTTDPADGNTVAPDNLAAHPTYTNDTWTTFGLTIPNIPMGLEMHQYIGPAGAGFMGIVRVTVLGVTYQRTQDSGAESWRTQAWAALPAGP